MRGIELLGVATSEQGWPVLELMCDCGVRVDVTIDGIPPTSVAITCNGCLSPHWLDFSPPAEATPHDPNNGTDIDPLLVPPGDHFEEVAGDG